MFFKMRLEVSAIILTRICKIQLHPNMQRAVKLPGIHEQIHFAEEEELKYQIKMKSGDKNYSNCKEQFISYLSIFYITSI